MSPSVTVNMDSLPGQHRLYGCPPSLYERSHFLWRKPDHLPETIWRWTRTLLRAVSIFNEQLVALGADL